ncbi:MAG: heme exporter protein CcmB [Candidatus Thermoplasmatota archaeon]|nr:heme exporter protein CcmB [Candidatus Thermoplasmatota archaeon]
MTGLLTTQLRWMVRARSVLATVLLTALTVLLAGAVALHDAQQRALAASALLYLVLALSGLVSTSRVLAAERDGGGLRGWLLTPVPRRDLYISRAVAMVALLMGVAVLSLVFTALLFPDQPRLLSPGPLLALLVGAAGLGPLGALTGWAALSSKAGELMGPILGLPLAAPLIISLLHATETQLTTGVAWTPSLTFATGYAVAVGALAYLLADHVTEVA